VPAFFAPAASYCGASAGVSAAQFARPRRLRVSSTPDASESAGAAAAISNGGAAQQLPLSLGQIMTQGVLRPRMASTCVGAAAFAPPPPSFYSDSLGKTLLLKQQESTLLHLRSRRRRVLNGTTTAANNSPAAVAVAAAAAREAASVYRLSSASCSSSSSGSDTDSAGASDDSCADTDDDANDYSRTRRGCGRVFGGFASSRVGGRARGRAGASTRARSRSRSHSRTHSGSRTRAVLGQALASAPSAAAATAATPTRRPYGFQRRPVPASTDAGAADAHSAALAEADGAATATDAGRSRSRTPPRVRQPAAPAAAVVAAVSAPQRRPSLPDAPTGLRAALRSSSTCAGSSAGTGHGAAPATAAVPALGSPDGSLKTPSVGGGRTRSRLLAPSLSSAAAAISRGSTPSLTTPAQMRGARPAFVPSLPAQSEACAGTVAGADTAAAGSGETPTVARFMCSPSALVLAVAVSEPVTVAVPASGDRRNVPGLCVSTSACYEGDAKRARPATRRRSIDMATDAALLPPPAIVLVSATAAAASSAAAAAAQLQCMVSPRKPTVASAHASVSGSMAPGPASATASASVHTLAPPALSAVRADTVATPSTRLTRNQRWLLGLPTGSRQRPAGGNPLSDITGNFNAAAPGAVLSRRLGSMRFDAPAVVCAANADCGTATTTGRLMRIKSGSAHTSATADTVGGQPGANTVLFVPGLVDSAEQSFREPTSVSMMQ
jgi:hypothetical protein